ncbi:MAG: AmmeMemoRadiSam system radical SAM enzyme [Bacteroidales bacterium]
MYKRAKYQKRIINREGESIECTLCPHNCIIKEGKKGICKSRVNLGGTLYTLAWNNPCTIAVDPIRKKPIHHFMEGSRTLSIAVEGCNLRCLNCQNHSISIGPPKREASSLYSPKEIVNRALEMGVPSISYTYSEPTTFYEYMLAITKEGKKVGLKNLLISNGYINPKPLQELAPYIDAANIDLKSFNPKVHLELTGAKLSPILESIKLLKKVGVWLEITHLMIPGYSDNLDHFKEMCQWLVSQSLNDTPLHISRFFPSHKLLTTPITPLSTIEEARKIASSIGIQRVILGNI